MSCQYTNPYNQNTAGYMQPEMSRVQNNPSYMNSQMPQPMNQMQPGAGMMQTAAPTGTTPLARQLPITPAGPIGTPIIPPGAFTGAVPAVTSGITPLASSMPQTPVGPETPVTVASSYYTAGFLRNFIGKNVRVEFVLGTTGTTSDRIGTLLEVGASYIVIQPLLTDDLLMCDLYSIRFVTIIY